MLLDLSEMGGKGIDGSLPLDFLFIPDTTDLHSGPKPFGG